MAPMAVPLAQMAIRLVVPMAITIAIGAIGTIVAKAALIVKFCTIVAIDVIGAIGAIVAIGTNGSPSSPFAPLSPLHHCPHCHKWIAIVAIAVNGATGSIGSPNDPLTLNGDCELSIAIEWIKLRHLIGANGRQWRSPLAPMDVAIVANGDCDRQWRHLPNRHWRQWSIHWRQQKRKTFNSTYIMGIAPITVHLLDNNMLIWHFY